MRPGIRMLLRPRWTLKNYHLSDRMTYNTTHRLAEATMSNDSYTPGEHAPMGEVALGSVIQP